MKKRLGKGLDALLPSTSFHEDEGTGGVKEIPIEKIYSNPFQPRHVFDEEKLEELARSIEEHGIVQPVVVCRTDSGYELVAGERRLRGAKIAGLKTIPAIVKDVDSLEKVELALIENLQREDLNPLEEAFAYKKLMEEFGFTQERLAKRLGKSRSAIANTVRLLSLSPEVQDAIANGKITAGQARPLVNIKNTEKQRELAQMIIERGLSSREIEKLVSREQERKKKKKKKLPNKGTKTGEKDIFILEIEDRLKHCFGTQVRIKTGKEQGKIEIYFYGDEDLERLIEIMLREN